MLYSIVSAVEELNIQGTDRFCTTGASDSPQTPKPSESPEPKRAPLPGSDAWRYTGKTRDDFADFEVTKGTTTQPPKPTGWWARQS